MNAEPVVEYHGHGPHGFVQYWADWVPDDQRVYFGGFWSKVPSMNCQRRPSAQAVTRWANTWGGDGWRNEESYFAACFDEVA